MRRSRTFIYRESFGKTVTKHDDVNNMHGLFKLLKSRVSLTAEQQTQVTKTSASSVSSASNTPLPLSSFSSSSSSSSSSPGTTPSKRSQSALSSSLRWSRKYDVLLCHSSEDSDAEEAGRLVAFLEAPPRGLRCFLRQRDDCPGAAVSTELCQAVQNSHMWALLITPSFLQDEWCQYMMHQALAEGPMSNRIVPLLHNLSRSQYPQELKFYFYIDLSRERAYSLLNNTVLKFLEELVKREKALESSMDHSSNELSLRGEESSSSEKLT